MPPQIVTSGLMMSAARLLENRPETGLGEDVLPRHHRDPGLRADLRDRLDVLGLARLLEPVGLILLEPFGQFDGVHGRQAAMDVEHQSTSGPKASRMAFTTFTACRIWSLGMKVRQGRGAGRI